MKPETVDRLRCILSEPEPNAKLALALLDAEVAEPTEFLVACQCNCHVKGSGIERHPDCAACEVALAEEQDAYEDELIAQVRAQEQAKRPTPEQVAEAVREAWDKGRVHGLHEARAPGPQIQPRATRQQRGTDLAPILSSLRGGQR